ncbi:hypothetical protein E2C01_029304 [Portunus trituberculatus]|uniref:Uncharacterized protein n=1 Tax=Portunus trituberculatus TaxID=210409 RepID=A0A5B7ERI7_PORTR|nr:hypothetical protein [Portunus trituberculatus]
MQPSPVALSPTSLFQPSRPDTLTRGKQKNRCDKEEIVALHLQQECEGSRNSIIAPAEVTEKGLQWRLTCVDRSIDIPSSAITSEVTDSGLFLELCLNAFPIQCQLSGVLTEVCISGSPQHVKLSHVPNVFLLTIFVSSRSPVGIPQQDGGTLTGVYQCLRVAML